ncbi:MAG: hypothetical protein QOF55_2381 [Thermoleophilaceae bacterium]|nr:hypothetical protein [Thermoleophilaceae bacterium]
MLGLAEKLRPVDSLPSVHEELIEVNKTLRLVLEALDGMRADLAVAQPGATARRARAAG